jgi:3-oxoacyl-[acyl-carrier-protein] synthase-3
MTAAKLYGVRVAGVGSAVPEKRLTNADLEKLVDTSDEWIVQRTGIHERRVVDPTKESTRTLATLALQRALADAGMQASDLDLVILGSVTSEMTCPSTACMIAGDIGAAPAGSFDLVAACCGFVYTANVADTLVRSGRYRAVGIIGCDTLSTIVDYADRGVCILFGDGAGAAVLVRDEDPSLGCIYQTMNSDAKMWDSLYIPRRPQDVPPSDADCKSPLGTLRMNGREVYKFAINKFREVIEDALAATGLGVDDISQFICHQSNLRIIEAAKEKLHLPDDKVFVNIDRFGNCSGGSVGLCFDQLWQAGKIKRGEHVLMCAFGGGLTWASGVWKL